MSQGLRDAALGGEAMADKVAWSGASGAADTASSSLLQKQSKLETKGR